MLFGAKMLAMSEKTASEGPPTCKGNRSPPPQLFHEMAVRRALEIVPEFGG